MIDQAVIAALDAFDQAHAHPGTCETCAIIAAARAAVQPPPAPSGGIYCVDCGVQHVKGCRVAIMEKWDAADGTMTAEQRQEALGLRPARVSWPLPVPPSGAPPAAPTVKALRDALVGSLHEHDWDDKCSGSSHCDLRTRLDAIIAATDAAARADERTRLSKGGPR